jgi:tol-pal system protein YbgF
MMRDTAGSGRQATKALQTAVLMLGAILPLAGASAQQGWPPAQQGWPPAQQQQQSVPPAQQPQTQPQRPPPQPKQQAKRPPPEAAPATGNEASLRQRVEQLEEQLVDLQVVVGTVESLARGGAATTSASFRGGVPTGGGSSGADTGRIAALETQVQALTAQLEQMADQLRQLQSGTPRGPSGPAPRGGVQPPAGTGGFATSTVPANDPIANLINSTDQRGAVAPPTSSPAGRQQYEAAYSQLLQQNYPAAEAGFSDFLARHPTDELAPNAQFWLGETHFVRGQWDSAAAAFLKVAQSHPRSDKAPDSLAKLAMSMERKGNKQAACRALQELRSRYPNPPAHVRTWEQAERRRAGCS